MCEIWGNFTTCLKTFWIACVLHVHHNHPHPFPQTNSYTAPIVSQAIFWVLYINNNWCLLQLYEADIIIIAPIYTQKL